MLEHFYNENVYLSSAILYYYLSLYSSKSVAIEKSPLFFFFTASVLMETHLVMKNNAMFLLELSSGTPKRIGSQKESPLDTNSSFPPPGPFQCLLSLGVNPSALKEDSHFPHEEVWIKIILY